LGDLAKDRLIADLTAASQLNSHNLQTSFLTCLSLVLAKTSSGLEIPHLEHFFMFCLLTPCHYKPKGPLLLLFNPSNLRKNKLSFRSKSILLCNRFKIPDKHPILKSPSCATMHHGIGLKNKIDLIL